MIITFIGSNAFSLKKKLDETVQAFVKKNGELAVEKFDGEETESKAIVEGLQSLPFLSQNKLVVVRNGSANKEFTEQIEQVISSISNSTDVIFYEPQIDKRTVYFKELKSKTQLEEFSEGDSHSLAKWLVEEANLQRGSLQMRDAQYLVERLGTNQVLLANELQKLLIYNPQVTKESIDLLTEPNPQSKVFDLLDAAFAGHKESALKLYDEQRAQKVEPQAILAMIAWQLNIITIAKYSKDRDLSEVSRDSGIKDYPLRKTRVLADNLSDKDLKKMVSGALEIDWGGKTSSLDMDEALKNYIISL